MRLRRALLLAWTLPPLIGSAACDLEQRTAPSVAVPLTAREPGPVATTALAPVPLATQADYDALEASWEGRRDPSGLLSVYAGIAKARDEAKLPADPLLLQRIAVMLSSSRGQDDWVKGATDIGDRLGKEAPENPHTRYLQGFLKRIILLAGAGDRQLVITGFNRVAAEQVIRDWGELVRLFPDYVGPHGHTGAQIREDIATLARGLAAFDARAKASDEDAGTPTAARPAAPEELKAMGDVAAFETGNAVERRVMCRDRAGAKRVGGPSASEKRVDFLCAIEIGTLAEAAERLAALVAADPATDACGEAGRLLGRYVGKSEERAVAALRERGLERCVPKAE
ncbi:MAG: hypothetical protein KC635_04100 [Myxococcales bacterium]|nr:hypothetical protein [Myxococcales bacterium]MCB9733073.1 hypothetical protein [Deltaproteobacteria bacterium]